MSRKKKRNANSITVFITVLVVVLAIGMGIISYAFLQKNVFDDSSEKSDQVSENTVDYDDNEESDDESYEDDSIDIANENIQDDEPEEDISDSDEQPVEEAKYAYLLENPDKMKAENIYPMEAKYSDVITMGFAGDILFDKNYAVMASLLNAGGDITRIVHPDLLEDMREMDIMIVNNEFPYSNRGTPTPEKTFTFRANPEYVKYLEEMGVDAVGIANNHAYDYGAEAFTDTLDTLEEAGVPYAGGGRNIDEASRAMTFLVNDRLISVLCATQIERLENPDTKGATKNSPGVFRCLDATNLCNQVRAYKETSDVVIVFVHWGTESTDELDFRQTDQAKQLEEAGADVVIGAHPHVLQGVDFINDMPVIYSVGNFVFSSKTLDGAMIRLVIKCDDDREEDDAIDVQFIPTVQSGCQVRKHNGGEVRRVVNYVNQISGGEFIDERGYLRKIN